MTADQNASVSVRLTDNAKQSEAGVGLKAAYSLLARRDIPAERLPKECEESDIEPDDFPVKGQRQAAITTNSRAISAVDGPATKVGDQHIEAVLLRRSTAIDIVRLKG